MKRRMLITVIALALVCAIAGAGTMAYFTSNAASTGNTFSAGTLIIGTLPSGETNPERAVFDAVNLNNLAPGDTVTQTTNLHNSGSLPLTLYRLTAANIELEGVNVENIPDFLPHYIGIVVKIGNDVVYDGNLRDMTAVNGGFFDPIKNIAAGSDSVMTVEATLDESAGNWWKNRNITCDFTIYARQEAVTDSGNPDGTQFTLANNNDLKVIGWNTATAPKETRFKFDWSNLPSLSFGANYYVIKAEIKHETGSPDITVSEDKKELYVLWRLVGSETEEYVYSEDFPGLADKISVDWTNKTLIFDQSVFDSSWKGFEAKFTAGTAQVGLGGSLDLSTFVGAINTPYMYWTLNRE